MQARIFVEEGVDKIRLTGGEPTLRKDLPAIAAEVGALPGLKTLAMTSNGVALRRKLPTLAAAGLSALNLSLDTLREPRFEALTRRKGAAAVLECIEEALRQGFTVKVNVVVMRGVNEDEVCDFVELTRRRRLNVRFIEYMPFDDNAWSKDKMVRSPPPCCMAMADARITCESLRAFAGTVWAGAAPGGCCLRLCGGAGGCGRLQCGAGSYAGACMRPRHRDGAARALAANYTPVAPCASGCGCEASRS